MITVETDDKGYFLTEGSLKIYKKQPITCRGKQPGKRTRTGVSQKKVADGQKVYENVFDLSNEEM